METLTTLLSFMGDLLVPTRQLREWNNDKLPLCIRFTSQDYDLSVSLNRADGGGQSNEERIEPEE